MSTARADLSGIVSGVVAKRGLAPRDDIRKPSWLFWERRTLNMHRLVGLWKEYRQFSAAPELEAEVRAAVAGNFKRSWWRGLGYGVVADVATIALSPEDVKSLVDVRENPKGTLQWIVLAASGGGVAFGVHTWIEGYLSPVYRGVLRELADSGFQVASLRKEKDGLMRVLTDITGLHVVVRTLGTKKSLWQEFRNEF